MSEEPETPATEMPEESAEDIGPIHPLQKLLDNPWLLLALGFVVPFLSYTVWGWVELLLTKKAELP
ncbi:MAG: hypothetical protein H6839_17055 [Planctomycetes bacterium]|nr:hypothetical protein [Planctomycetota bacterium]